MRTNGPVAALFMIPAMLFVVLFSIVPMLEVVWFSLLDYSFFGPHSFIGLDNYRRLLSDPNFWHTLVNSLLYILVTPVLIIVSLVVALSVRDAVRSAAILRLFFFLPVITPIIVVGIMWRWIFTEETGLFNYILSLAGAGPVAWLTDHPTNMVSVMILTVWRGFGYYMMVILAGLTLIPKEVEEAAVLDGTTPLTHVLHIILPALRPTLLFIFVVSSASAVKLFTELYVLIPGVPMDNKTLVAFLYRSSFERFEFGYGSAVAVVLFMLTAGLSYLNIRLMEERQ